jgi:ATP synthase protein I
MSADDDRERAGKRESGGAGDDRLKALSERIEAGRRVNAERQGPPPGANNSGMAQALKLGSEFIAGVLVGIALGWGFDYFLGTSPWGLIVFLLLGFAAGTLNVMRAVGAVAEPDPHRFKRRGDDDKK